MWLIYKKLIVDRVVDLCIFNWSKPTWLWPMDSVITGTLIMSVWEYGEFNSAGLFLHHFPGVTELYRFGRWEESQSQSQALTAKRCFLCSLAKINTASAPLCVNLASLSVSTALADSQLFWWPHRLTSASHISVPRLHGTVPNHKAVNTSARFTPADSLVG